jgi:hypothetical protein
MIGDMLLEIAQLALVGVAVGLLVGFATKVRLEG